MATVLPGDLTDDRLWSRESGGCLPRCPCWGSYVALFGRKRADGPLESTSRRDVASLDAASGVPIAASADATKQDVEKLEVGRQLPAKSASSWSPPILHQPRCCSSPPGALPTDSCTGAGSGCLIGRLDCCDAHGSPSSSCSPPPKQQPSAHLRKATHSFPEKSIDEQTEDKSHLRSVVQGSSAWRCGLAPPLGFAEALQSATEECIVCASTERCLPERDTSFHTSQEPAMDEKSVVRPMVSPWRGPVESRECEPVELLGHLLVARREAHRRKVGFICRSSQAM